MKASSTALAVALGTLLAAPALAVSIDKVTVTPATGARAGDKVTLQVDMRDTDQGLCGLSVNYGDGKIDLLKIKPDTKLPLIFEHTYKAAGTVKIEVRGKRVENALGCDNKQKFDYVLAPAAAATSAAVPTASATCPADWALKGKIAKNGTYTCIPKKGVKDAKKPEQTLPCPTGTSYFSKGKSLGCEKS